MRVAVSNLILSVAIYSRCSYYRHLLARANEPCVWALPPSLHSHDSVATVLQASCHASRRPPVTPGGQLQLIARVAGMALPSFCCLPLLAVIFLLPQPPVLQTLHSASTLLSGWAIDVCVL